MAAQKRAPKLRIVASNPPEVIAEQHARRRWDHWKLGTIGDPIATIDEISLLVDAIRDGLVHWSVKAESARRKMRKLAGTEEVTEEAFAKLVEGGEAAFAAHGAAFKSYLESQQKLQAYVGAVARIAAAVWPARRELTQAEEAEMFLQFAWLASMRVRGGVLDLEAATLDAQRTMARLWPEREARISSDETREALREVIRGEGRRGRPKKGERRIKSEDARAALLAAVGLSITREAMKKSKLRARHRKPGTSPRPI